MENKKNINEGYQPSGEEKRGYQPSNSPKTETSIPPKGGSSVSNVKTDKK